jgi:NADPH:quinone reductase-like Zn-dependent oxidoreductase
VRGITVGEIGAPPRLKDLPEPTAGADETLVQIEAAAVGHLDLTVAAGEFPVRPPSPYVPGTDGAGRVLASGSFEIGTRVWIRGGGVGLTRNGCWADRVVVPDSSVHPLIEDVPPALAATFFVPASTAQLAVHDVGRFSRGERVAVRGGVGAVGALAVQMALTAGAGEVVAIVRSAAQAARVPRGASARVAPTQPELAQLAGAGFDLVIDTVGGPDLVALLPALRPGGRLVLVGYVGGVVAELPLTLLIGQDVQLLPVNGLRHEVRAFTAVAPGLLRDLARGELDLPVRTHPFSAFDRAIEDVRSAGGGRVALLAGDTRGRWEG